MRLSTSEYIAATARDFPAWSTVLFIMSLGLMLGTVGAIARVQSRQAKRRIYWLGWISAAGCAALSLLPLGIRTVVITFVGFTFAITFWAYLTTPYLKVGSRIFALTMAASRPDRDSAADEEESPSLTPPVDSYPGPVSAATAWWILAILIALNAAGVYVGGWVLQTVVLTVILCVVSTVSGIDDATRRLAAARGQYVQAFVIVIASIPLWLAPVIAYSVGYSIGRVRPMGKGRHSVSN